MAGPQPKPAKANADAHREDDDDSDDGQDVADIPGKDVGGGALGGDGGGGGGDGGDDGTMGGGDGLSIPNINTKTLIVAGVGAVAAYALYRYLKSRPTSAQRAMQEAAGGDDDNDSLDTGDGVVAEETVPDIPDDPEDPLRADHEAGKYIFGWDDE